ATWTFTPSVALAEGAHTLSFRSVDNASATSPSAVRHITVDTVAPTLGVTSGPADVGLTSSATPTYGGSAADTGSGLARVEASVDSAAFATTGVTCTGCGTASATWTFRPGTALADGVHTVAVRAVDNASLAPAATNRS